MKFVGGIVAVVLLAAFVGPVVLKLNDVALWIVAGIGFAMMLVDLVQSLRTKDE